jgi:restriction system protein
MSESRSFFTKVAGVTFNNDDGSRRQTIIARCSVGEQLVLVRDPSNRFDAGAVKVMRSNGEQLGFLPEHITRGGHSSGMAWCMDRGDTFRCAISSLTGGGPGAILGVNIELTENIDTRDESTIPSRSESSAKEISSMADTNLQLASDGQDIKISTTVSYGARGAATYECKVFHKGLKKHAVIQAGSTDLLLKKAKAQMNHWDSDWQKETALRRTIEAQKILEPLRGILASGIVVDPTLDREACKVKAPFVIVAPTVAALPAEPTPDKAPSAPDPDDWKYKAHLSLLDRVISSRKERRLADAEKKLLDDVNAWKGICSALSSQHASSLEAHRITTERLMKQHAQALSKWEKKRAVYYEEQAKQHAAMDELWKRYEARHPDAVVEYCSRVLSACSYPGCVPREFEFDFNPDTGILLVNCKLPAPADIPKLCEVRYVQATDTLVEKFLSEVESARMYDDVLYQITLRTIHELFQSDSVKALAAIVFNGIVTSTDKSTGNEATACILSVQASRDAFLSINLEKVDSKACFRQLKGVGSSKLHSVTPVAPIMMLKKDDSRFITSYGVADHLNEGFNLATMDWEDFEHLIREIFEKEFSYTGGEVKVTQASRDGGVDAIAFDPDPIRGGRIVIQAKRYAYTVGVSAVRDLYGTVMNEGASKGILVTTSDYGPDAYDFASGKPLTLLSGANLLSLLGKHGMRAHINLSQARVIAHEQAKKARQ